ncbi:hypothetical protein [Methylophilus aquaticus]|uniref:Pre-toxin TG domain-containing protein n=1 Tax=Methylophilus aquaticus TaxID=1971610 RepID=A0ABT9JVQ1_9PROT|nr:hypothetical protein [Methylophilus aquaticus]MDP8568589.1 hypothetical protein [Methylophilus aquaticus]
MFSATDNANDSLTSLVLKKISVTAQDVVPALLSSRADSIAIGVGDLVQDVAKTINNNKALRYSLEVLDIVGAPVAYAARKAIEDTYIGSKLQEAQEYVFNKASGLFTGVGYDTLSAQSGGLGVFSVLSVAASGGAKRLLDDVSNITQVVKNKLDGLAREKLTKVELQNQYPNASVQSERALRNADGTRAIDEYSNSGRNIDHVVIENGQVVRSVETTSMTANKAAQIAKENRIREAGGNYVRDKTTGNLIDLGTIQTEILRRK